MQTQLPQAINLEEISEDDLLPDGEYDLCIKKAVVEENKAGTGTVLKITFDVVHADYDNKLVWDNMNVTHEKANAQRMGLMRLKALCTAVGIYGTFRDAKELVGKTCRASIGHEPAQNGYKAKNTIDAYYPQDVAGTVKFDDDDIPF